MRERPTAPKPAEFECEECGCDITEDEFSDNDGLCDECDFHSKVRTN